MTETTGGAVIARMLQNESVEKVFGIIDGTYFGYYAALHRLGIEIVTPRHETCAAHMAGTYARITGKLGVCMASNGPGVTNLLPGLVVEQARARRSSIARRHGRQVQAPQTTSDHPRCHRSREPSDAAESSGPRRRVA